MYKKLFSLAVASVLLTGCESDTGTTPIHDPRTPLAISAGVTTRATDALWHANDAIGIYTLKGGTVYDQQANYRYINNAGEGASATFAPADAANTAYFPEDGSELDVIAYYPYQQSTGGEGILTIEVSDQSSLPKIDLMTSALSTGHSKEKVDVALQFRHRLAKLVMVLKSDETTADIDLAGATITLQGTATQGTYHLMEQQITEATAIADIALVGRTAIVMPTEAGKGVSFTVTAGDKEFNATMPDPIALAAGKVTTVAITLQTLNSGDTQAAISATITDWEGGPTAEMDAIRFVAPVNPETGAPEINRFTVMKNGASPTLYEYVDGAWSASPAFFLVEETTAEDEFTATAEGETDKISKLKDLLTAGPATMNSAGIIELPFEHSMAKLTINLHEGEGFTGNPANAKVTYEEISYFGNGKTFIIHPKEYAAGAVIAIVEIGGYSYEAVAKEAISFAKGTVNKLAITLKVEEQGNRIAAMRVTDKPWEIGTQSTATAIHFVPPTSPITHSPDVATFTVMKNGEEPTLYTFTSGLWSASPAFFMVEETLADDRFTATATGIADPITGITDDLAAPEAAMNSEGIIHLEFEHVKAMLTVTLTKGIDFPAAIDLNKAVVELKEFPGKTVTGVNNTFIVEPTTTDIAKGTEVASITVGGITYQATLAEPLKLEKGKKTLLTIALSPTDTGISVT
ncbi:fimbrillin family protein, partial [Parabacteroides sp. OttesenSCG-928-N08]|nr:fimbrillin family protein [Parabacteroides sp. OttesenSCG-928-N08]